MNIKPIKIELPIGYQDKHGRLCNHVTIGKLPTGADWLAIEQGRYADDDILLPYFELKASITEFGGLPLPISIDSFLSLASLDLDAIREAYLRFVQSNKGGKKSELINANMVRLAVGHQANNIRFTHLEFYSMGETAQLLQGLERIKHLGKWDAIFVRIAASVKRLTTHSGLLSLCPVTHEVLAAMNIFDLKDLMNFFSLRAQSSLIASGYIGAVIPAPKISLN